MEVLLVQNELALMNARFFVKVHIVGIRKAKASQFRLKAAHVLWATAKCRHPSSPEGKCSSDEKCLHFDGGRTFSTSCACDYSAHVSEDADSSS
jgi:hypothetical protein